jgi:citrate lyase subunit beta/citryl-CoA lyase
MIPSFLMVADFSPATLAAARALGVAAAIVDAAQLTGMAPDALPRAILHVRIAAADDAAALAGAMAAAPAGILLADAAAGQDVARLDARLAVAEAERGLPHGATRILAVAGATPAALFAMDSFIGCSARLSGLIHDPAALARSLGAEEPSDLQRIARALTVAAAHAAGVVAIDGDDRIDAETARREGFGGKLVAAPAV